MSKLPLSNIIRVTLISAARGLAFVNTSALAIITDDVPIPADYGDSRTYLDAIGVSEDFGSSSATARLAEKIFSQTPNILTGGGFLVIIPRLQAAPAAPAVVTSKNTVDLTALTASDYNINVDVDGGGAADLLIGPIDSTDLVNAAASLNSIAVVGAGLLFKLSGEVTAAKITLETTTTGAASSIDIGTATTGTDIATGIAMKDETATGADAGLERVKDTIIRTAGAIEYFGIVLTEKMSDVDVLETASLMQTLPKIIFLASNTQADILGVYKTLKDAGYTHSRCLYYSTSEASALDMAAAYAGRGLSVNFDADNTALTMHLKDLVGLVADNISQSVYDDAKNQGVDIYPDFGIPKVQSFGANLFFDQVYQRLAFQLRLQIAGFNFLAQTQTKIPQTEEGMTALKGEFRDVCARFVNVGVLAPGEWNDSTTFGDPETHERVIREAGYYVYSSPIAQQSQTQRGQRIAVPVQIAAKEAGAIHTSDVAVFVEA
jgi:hypothetical protein